MSEDTKLDLAAIKAKCAAATRGPSYDGGAALVAAARSDVPALVAEVERLREERDDQASLVEVFEDEAKRLRSDLASCYRLTGADPDGDDDAMLATKAVNAVRRLRAESDHQGTRADEFAEEVKKMAGERDAAQAAIELIKMDRRFAQENADGYRVRLGIVMRENDTFAATVKKLRDDIAEAAGVNAANLNTLRSVRERVSELEALVGRVADAPDSPTAWETIRSQALRSLLAKGGA